MPLVLLLALALLPVSGCSAALENTRALAGKTVKQKMKMRAAGFRRSYRVHVPAGYDPARPTPLVVVLHGAFSSAREIEQDSGFSDLADREGFLVLYPNGITLFGLLQHWNAGHCCGKAAADGVDDTGYLKAAIREVSGRLSVDPARVYMTGFSNGGMMVHRFGAENAELLAAIAPLAGSAGGRPDPSAPLWQIPEPAVPLPVAIMHGRRDDQVPYDGGGANGAPGGRQFLSVAACADFWRRADGCKPPGEETRLHDGTVTLRAWRNCRDGAEVLVYTWEDWGHVWPGPPFTDHLAADDPFRDFPTAETIWDFFRRHRREAPPP